MRSVQPSRVPSGAACGAGRRPARGHSASSDPRAPAGPSCRPARGPPPPSAVRPVGPRPCRRPARTRTHRGSRFGVVEVSRTVTIAAPPAEVWAVFMDVESWPTWTESMRQVRSLDDGPLPRRVPRRDHPARVPEGGLGRDRARRGAVVQLGERGAGSALGGHHEVAAEGEGSVVTLRLSQSGPLAGVMGLVFGRRTRRYVDLEADGLKARVEGAPTRLAPCEHLVSPIDGAPTRFDTASKWIPSPSPRPRPPPAPATTPAPWPAPWWRRCPRCRRLEPRDLPDGVDAGRRAVGRGGRRWGLRRRPAPARRPPAARRPATATPAPACSSTAATSPAERLNVADTVKVQWQAYLGAGPPPPLGHGPGAGRHRRGHLGAPRRVLRHQHPRRQRGPLRRRRARRSRAQRARPLRRGAGQARAGPTGHRPEPEPVQGCPRRRRRRPARSTSGRAAPARRWCCGSSCRCLVSLVNVAHPLDPRPDYTVTPLRVTAWRGAPASPDDPARTASPEAERAYLNTEAEAARWAWCSRTGAIVHDEVVRARAPWSHVVRGRPDAPHRRRRRQPGRRLRALRRPRPRRALQRARTRWWPRATSSSSPGRRCARPRVGR